MYVAREARRRLLSFAALGILSVAGDLLLPRMFAAHESNVERDQRIATALRSAGVELRIERDCPRGVRGYFSPLLAGVGGPGIVLCIDNHEGAGDMAHTEAHEMAHAAQHCLEPRGLVLNDLFEITELVIAQLRESRSTFRDLHELEMQRVRAHQAQCADGLIPNKTYCDNLPNRLNEKPLAEYPILIRADAGEKLSLADLVGVPELLEIRELYPPQDRYAELEARAFAFLGRDAALQAIAASCSGTGFQSTR